MRVERNSATIWIACCALAGGIAFGCQTAVQIGTAQGWLDCAHLSFVTSLTQCIDFPDRLYEAEFSASVFNSALAVLITAMR